MERCSIWRSERKRTLPAPNPARGRSPLDPAFLGIELSEIAVILCLGNNFLGNTWGNNLSGIAAVSWAIVLC
ncbi:MAG: hypothetical protein FWC89_11005 [Defluviitaleaceae bacterium]|nr:hypothetical protein [Defluviitaleaceae bacterium]